MPTTKHASGRRSGESGRSERAEEAGSRQPSSQRPQRRGLFARARSALARAPRALVRGLRRVLSSTPVQVLAAIGLLVAMALGATGTTGLPGLGDEAPRGTRVSALGALGGAEETAPRADAAPAVQPVAEQVRTHHPDLVIENAPGTPNMAALRSTDGLTGVAAAGKFRAVLDAGPRPPDAGLEAKGLQVLAVSPRQFRPLTPDVTAQSAGVWQRLAEGDVIVRHDIAQQLGLELGREYTLRRQHGGGEVQVRIGAFASNGAPPLAGLLVPSSVGRSLGVARPDTVIGAVAGERSARTVGEALVEQLGGGDLTLRYLPRSQQAELAGEARSHVDSFSYRDRGDGTIAMDPGWVQEWIVQVDLPHLGTAKCNRVMVPQLLAALQEIEAAGLAGQLNPEQFGGCWSPRHVLFDPSRSLSMHAWGLAIDINTATNGYGQTPQMDPRIVELFERWGFEWGGDWSVPDGMHFQLERIVSTG